VDDLRVGAAVRAVRKKRGWRQLDVATRSGASRAFVSQVERGHLGTGSLDTLRRVAAALDVRLDIIPRWRGADLDRLLGAGHSAMHESVARYLSSLPRWLFEPEVSFSIYGERGIIDILAWHADRRCLLVIELKTVIADVQALVGDIDRKKRLAWRVARERGWEPLTVSCWVIVARTKTNQRRIESHRTMLRAALPQDGHAMRSWLHSPNGSVRGLSMWTDVSPGNTGPSRRAAKHGAASGRDRREGHLSAPIDI
jgi:transcriptional regulator with XRE-family HTH domain